LAQQAQVTKGVIAISKFFSLLIMIYC